MKTLIAWLLLGVLSASAATISGGTFSAPRKGQVGAGFLRNWWFEIESNPTAINRNIGGGSTSTVAYKDRSYTEVVSSTTVTDFSWPFSHQLNRPSVETVARTSSNSGAVIPNAANPFLWDFVGAGTATLTLSSPGCNYTATITATSTTSMSRTFVSWASNSVALNAVNAIDSRIAGKSAATAKPLYTTQNHTTGTYVRNPNFWAADLNLTCISPWNSMGGGTRAGTLISPRHIAFATHYPISNGSTIRFVSMDNTMVSRTIVSQKQAAGDIVIAILDSDVPASIGFARVLPKQINTAFAGTYRAGSAQVPVPEGAEIVGGYRWPVPVLAIDQEEKGSVMDFGYTNSRGSVMFSSPTDAQRLAFYKYAVGGDSGNPIFLIINNQLVLTSTFTTPLGGPDIAGFETEVNSTMTTLSTSVSAGTNYQLTVVDLSGFSSF